MKKIKKVKKSLPIGVSLDEREGVFEHSFKCLTCGLHFSLFSWKYKRDYAICPECGHRVGELCHTVKVLSTSKAFVLGGDEICCHHGSSIPYLSAPTLEHYLFIEKTRIDAVRSESFAKQGKEGCVAEGVLEGQSNN